MKRLTAAQAWEKMQKWAYEDNQSAAAKLYRHLQTTDEFVPDEVAVLVGCGLANVSLTMSYMRQAGFRFRRLGKKAGSPQRITHRPTEAPTDATEVIPARRSRVSGRLAALPPALPAPYPPLGARLMVRALAFTDGDQLVMQLSDGNGRAWRVTVDGHTAS